MVVKMCFLSGYYQNITINTFSLAVYVCTHVNTSLVFARVRRPSRTSGSAQLHRNPQQIGMAKPHATLLQPTVHYE